MGSLVVEGRLSCPAACRILVPWPGIQPASPTLQGGFLTTTPPGSPLPYTLLSSFIWPVACGGLGVGARLTGNLWRLLSQVTYVTLAQSLCSVQSLSYVWLFATPWTAALSITNSQSLLKLMSIESVMPPNHLILCHPLLLPPSIFLSIRVFSNESVLCIRWPKYCSLSFSISLSNEYSGLISFRMDWLDLLAVQGTLATVPMGTQSKGLLAQSLDLS